MFKFSFFDQYKRYKHLKQSSSVLRVGTISSPSMIIDYAHESVIKNQYLLSS